MIMIIEGNQHPRLEEAYALRAKILHDKLGWKVNVIDGKEMDELDDANPVHMLYMINDQLKGYMRLLPTTGPTLLARFFSDVFHEGLSAPDIWEASKFCIDADKPDLAYHSAVMFAGLGQFCWRNNIESITGIVNEKVMRAYNRGGINLRSLEYVKIDNEPMYSIVYRITRDNLKSMEKWFNDNTHNILDDATLIYPQRGTHP